MRTARGWILFIITILFFSCQKEPVLFCPCTNTHPGLACREYQYSSGDYAGYIDYEYLPDGKLAAKSYYSSQHFFIREEFQYNEKGLLIITSRTDASHNLLETELRNYHTFDSIANITTIKGSDTVQRIFVQFNPKKQRELVTTLQKGQYTSEKYEYDEKDVLYRISSLGNYGELLGYQDYIFYTNKMVRVNNFTADGLVDGYEVIAYNTQGKIQEKNHYSSLNQIDKRELFQYHDDFLLKKSVYLGEHLTTYYLYQYK